MCQKPMRRNGQQTGSAYAKIATMVSLTKVIDGQPAGDALPNRESRRRNLDLHSPGLAPQLSDDVTPDKSRYRKLTRYQYVRYTRSWIGILSRAVWRSRTRQVESVRDRPLIAGAITAKGDPFLRLAGLAALPSCVRAGGMTGAFFDKKLR
jgi:hypothetical protein